MTVTEHPIVFYILGIPVRDTVVITWITMAIIVLVVILLKWRWPNLLESLLEMVIGVVDDAMDVDDLHPYIPLLGSLLVFVLVANMVSILPVMKSPTSDINTAIALALVVVLSVHVFGVRKKGVWGYLKDFASPIVLFPIELIGQVSRTLSLSMRLFGNIVSGDLIVAIVFAIIPSILPISMIAVSMVSGILQAYVITTLAALFISSAVEINEEEARIKAEKAAIKRSKRMRKEIANG